MEALPMSGFSFFHMIASSASTHWIPLSLTTWPEAESSRSDFYFFKNPYIIPATFGPLVPQPFKVSDHVPKLYNEKNGN